MYFRKLAKKMLLKKELPIFILFIKTHEGLLSFTQFVFFITYDLKPGIVDALAIREYIHKKSFFLVVGPLRLYLH